MLKVEKTIQYSDVINKLEQILHREKHEQNINQHTIDVLTELYNYFPNDLVDLYDMTLPKRCIDEIEKSNRLQAVIIYRNFYDCGLKEAKDAIDRVILILTEIVQ